MASTSGARRRAALRSSLPLVLGRESANRSLFFDSRVRRIDVSSCVFAAAHTKQHVSQGQSGGNRPAAGNKIAER
jgi:hypothetical protein